MGPQVGLCGRGRGAPQIFQPIPRVAEEHLHKSARLMTDENSGYIVIGHEYVRSNVTTNTIESSWAILKRGINGV